MNDLTVSCVHVTPIETNCYILYTNDLKYSAVVDPGEYSFDLISSLKNIGIESLTYILLTHGHFDHIDGTAELKENFGGSIVISKTDEAAFSDSTLSLSGEFGSFSKYPEKADITVSDGDELQFGEHIIRVISTPGHTSGSVCYLISDIIFTGDTLFKSSCGRTDFKTGDLDEMLSSLQKLVSLEGDYTVYPGHMGFSTLEKERNHNPYIKSQI